MIVSFVLYIVILMSLTSSKALIFVVKTDYVVSWYAWDYIYPFIGAMFLSDFNTINSVSGSFLGILKWLQP